ncbi:zinc ribbon domain-containing protein [Halalkalibacter sp. APA_J-10(15)]|uniref:zinc ribbon domain-containing protein n=1 Tax=Halalkalibacter sp. APA_J-10(15) TaxID=2933805 RepID=UPI001FF253E8|nr:zinc ribbon domain-containing protein [Halalkalibacter sp. APA_J-10(15)]MCK0470233.1 zinc ribbon domain-containing protein [Halalkalibacter sp. APA_J-10(15)]
MTNCTNCQAPLEAEAKFCTSCGTKTSDTGEIAAASTTTEAAQNAYLEQSKEVGKQYFSFAKSALKHPYQFSAHLGQNNMINGLISMILYSILLPLFLYNVLRKMSMGFMPLSFSDIVFMPAIVSIIMLLILAAIMLGVAKLMKVEVNYKTIIARFGAFMTIPTAILIVANILILVSIITFSVLLVILASLGYFVAIAVTIFSLHRENNGGLDTFYGIFLTYVALGFLSYLVSESILTDLVERMTFMNFF